MIKVISPKTRIVAISVLVFIVLIVLILNVVSTWTYKRGLDALSEQGNIRLELYINYLEGVLEKYESLPELLAIDENLVRALLSPHENMRIEKLNRYLETINKVSDALDTYLMNRDGLTIAASNWQGERPFIGRNFSYRPYFKQAMSGKLGRYFALGTTSSRRGYYFAYPVRKNGEILGAVVVKIDIDNVEQKWAHRDESFIVTDPDGVIFITTRPEWRYNALEPLGEEVIERIVESHRYPDAKLLPLSEDVVMSGNEMKILNIIVAGESKAKRMLKQSQKMPQAGWTVHILTDIGVLKERMIWSSVMAASAFFLIYLITLMLFQRQHRLGQLKQIEEDARRGLQEANELLESRVLDRTLQLTESNNLLRKEIAERKLTEVKLKKTRKELIHSAKLAVLGQMAAGINHELNQPLAAIRSYTDNGKQYLQKGRMEDAMWNLEQIGELTERMAQIGIQLKLFSRKSSGLVTVVALHGVIDGALEILKPSYRKAGVKITTEINPDTIKVHANHVLLQQVLVNLIGNGIQALEGQTEKIIQISAKIIGKCVIICVQDNGPGIKEECVKKIFDPFYTTKKPGQGLGLGLTISDRIVRSTGGKIVFVDNPNGALFEITLNAA